jgi:hypothetical protein
MNKIKLVAVDLAKMNYAASAPALSPTWTCAVVASTM